MRERKQIQVSKLALQIFAGKGLEVLCPFHKANLTDMVFSVDLFFYYYVCKYQSILVWGLVCPHLEQGVKESN